jgi:hypothetical protein
MNAPGAEADAEKRFPYRISEWYLLRHELAREEREKVCHKFTRP